MFFTCTGLYIYVTLFSELCSPSKTKPVLDSSHMVIPFNLGGDVDQTFCSSSQMSMWYKMLYLLLRSIIIVLLWIWYCPLILSLLEVQVTHNFKFFAPKYFNLILYKRYFIQILLVYSYVCKLHISYAQTGAASIKYCDCTLILSRSTQLSHKKIIIYIGSWHNTKNTLLITSHNNKFSVYRVTSYNYS